MNRNLKSVGMLMGMMLAAGLAARAQQASSARVTIEYYYKLKPWTAKEWLALYKKNHNPILREHMKSGLLLSEKLYERRFHAAAPAWDYKITMEWRDWAALDQARHREAEIIRELYPNTAEHEQLEKRRWEITEAHWDDVLNEVPLE